MGRLDHIKQNDSTENTGDGGKNTGVELSQQTQKYLEGIGRRQPTQEQNVQHLDCGGNIYGDSHGSKTAHGRNNGMGGREHHEGSKTAHGRNNGMEGREHHEGSKTAHGRNNGMEGREHHEGGSKTAHGRNNGMEGREQHASGDQAGTKQEAGKRLDDLIHSKQQREQHASGDHAGTKQEAGKRLDDLIHSKQQREHQEGRDNSHARQRDGEKDFAKHVSEMLVDTPDGNKGLSAKSMTEMIRHLGDVKNNGTPEQLQHSLEELNKMLKANGIGAEIQSVSTASKSGPEITVKQASGSVQVFSTNILGGIEVRDK